MAASLDNAAFRKFSTLAVNGRSCCGFAAVRRVQDFIFAVRNDDEVVSAAEDGGPHGARRLAEEAAAAYGELKRRYADALAATVSCLLYTSRCV